MEEQPNVSPEEQQLYDDTVTRAFKLIVDDKSQEVRPEVLKSLQGDDPKEALAQTAATIFFRVEQEAAKAGQSLDEVKEQAGAEIFSKLAEIASGVGPVDFMADDDAFNGAFYLAVDELRQLEANAGMIDQQKATAEFSEMAAADREGRLDSIMQGM